MVALTGFRSSAELGNLIPILKQHCSDAEFREFSDAITLAMTTIQMSVTEKAMAQVPGLDAELAAKVSTFGRVF